MNFTLRPWQLSDIESLIKYANNYEIAKNLTNHFPYPYTRESGENFIAMATREEPFKIMAIELGGEAVGSIGVFPQTDIFCKNAEMGYWLAQPFWGKGIVTQAIIQMCAYGFKTWDLNRIFARPFGTNRGSQRVLEKAGFTLEARFEKTLFKNGVYEDELVYAFRRQA